jgi:branched-chain amino acid transport system ATP-binding protein
VIRVAAASTHPPKDDVALRTLGLSWRVGGFTIVDDVDLAVRRGEFLSVIGPNGAGKSTLVNLLSGVYKPSAGVIHLDGRDVTGLRTAHRVRRGLGRTFQTSSLFPGLTVLENARLAAQAALGKSLNPLQGPRSTDEASKRALERMDEVGLAGRGEALVSNLAYGDKRKLEIAVALCGDPKVLLLDEPTAGVSSEEVFPLIDVVRQVHAAGRTIVMVEHHMDLVIATSDRIAVMKDGRLIRCDTPSAVMADAEVQSAYLGQEI